MGTIWFDRVSNIIVARAKIALVSAIFLIGTAFPVVRKGPKPHPRCHMICTPEVIKLTKTVQPIYPAKAVRKGIEGQVVLELTVAKDGSVSEVSLIKGKPILAEAAMQATKQWRYEPFRLNNQPVELSIRVTVNFSLAGPKR